jgi:carbon storage regulator CsrA
MLVLSRKKDETIILRGPNMDEIKITVVRIDNKNKVRIGIEADKDIMVLRSELTELKPNNTVDNLSIDGRNS